MPPKTVGLLRVKNEARWIERVIRSIQPACSSILVFDDHSTDATADMCEALGCTVYRSAFAGLDETRDKQFLLDEGYRIAELGDCCLMVDGDEELHADDVPALRAAAAGAGACWSFHIVYLWDRPDQIRVDRWYREFRRPSLFRLTQPGLSFMKTRNGGNFHCSSAPEQLLQRIIPAPVRLLHYGYMHREDRVRKYEWYNRIDPGNPIEDGYRHMVVGDLFPADAQFRHAGPLELRPL